MKQGRYVLITEEHKAALWDAMQGGELSEAQVSRLLLRCHDICAAWEAAPEYPYFAGGSTTFPQTAGRPWPTAVNATSGTATYTTELPKDPPPDSDAGMVA